MSHIHLMRSSTAVVSDSLLLAAAKIRMRHGLAMTAGAWAILDKVKAGQALSHVERQALRSELFPRPIR